VGWLRVARQGKGQKAKHLVVFVHGTGDTALLGDDHRRWWQGGSRFTEGLKRFTKKIAEEIGPSDAEPVEFDYAAFRWNGLNTKRDRRRAAFNLYDWMVNPVFGPGSPAVWLDSENTSKFQPEAYDKVHFIAHSHGGNVFTEALLIAAEAESRDGILAKLGKWITVGTPFLRTAAVGRSNFFARIFAVFPTVMLIVSIGAVAVLSLFAPENGWVGFSKGLWSVLAPSDLNPLRVETLADLLRWVLILAALIWGGLGFYRSRRIKRANRKLLPKRLDWYRRIGELRETQHRKSRFAEQVKGRLDPAFLSRVYEEKNFWKFHARFAGRWINIYSAHDEAITALSRFDGGLGTPLARRVAAAASRYITSALLLIGGGAALVALLLQYPFTDGQQDTLFLGGLASAVLFIAFSRVVAPQIVRSLVYAIFDSLWSILRRRGLGLDTSFGSIVNAAPSLNRFNDRGRKRGSFARLGDLRDRPLPVRVEADLYEATHQPAYDDGVERQDLIASSDRLEGQDEFIAFLLRETGKRPLIHVSYFRSHLVTAQIAYALVHDEVDGAEGDWEAPDKDTLRKRHRQIGQSYTGKRPEDAAPPVLRRTG
jgi:hypothetical protein